MSSMRRAGFGYAALALALVVVFAPRPWSEDSLRTGGESGLLISRALAPTIDAVNIPERDSGRAMRDPVTALWIVCLLAVAVGAQRWRAFALIDPPSRRWLDTAVAIRGCRAPPRSLA